MSKCKYKKDCLHFRTNSDTCMSGGDIYCGIYRTFETSSFQELSTNDGPLIPFQEAVEVRRLEDIEREYVKSVLKFELIALIKELKI